MAAEGQSAVTPTGIGEIVIVGRKIVGRRGPRRATVLGALMVGVALVLSACSSQQPAVVVTITTTPGLTSPVTVPSLTYLPPTDPASSASGAGEPATPNNPSGQAGAADTKKTSATGPTSTKKAAHKTKASDNRAKRSAPVKMRVSANPAFGTKKMAPNDPITVTVFNAELQKVLVLGDDGSTVRGKITNQRHTWTRTERMRYGVKYTLTGTAKAADGSKHTIMGTFRTVNPKKTMAAYVNIPNGKTVGIASPIIITFAGVVKDRAAAEKRLQVTVNGGKKIAGSWGWMQDEDILGHGHKQSRVHFRPKHYWPGGTRVHLSAKLYGVDLGGSWGREDVVRNFRIGPDLRVVAKVSSHRLLVIKNDKVKKNFPVSYGVSKSQNAGRTTVSGIHVITEKKPGAFTMCNPKYGYCGVKEYWGVRINNNGEFIHANLKVARAGLLGKANVSHGCINMSMADAKTFFHMVYYGVPVVVRGTGVKMSYADYIWDWSVPYSTWKTFSAL